MPSQWVGGAGTLGVDRRRSRACVFVEIQNTFFFPDDEVQQAIAVNIRKCRGRGEPHTDAGERVGGVGAQQCRSGDETVPVFS